VEIKVESEETFCSEKWGNSVTEPLCTTVGAKWIGEAQHVELRVKRKWRSFWLVDTVKSRPQKVCR